MVSLVVTKEAAPEVVKMVKAKAATEVASVGVAEKGMETRVMVDRVAAAKAGVAMAPEVWGRAVGDNVVATPVAMLVAEVKANLVVAVGGWAIMAMAVEEETAQVRAAGVQAALWEVVAAEVAEMVGELSVAAPQVALLAVEQVGGEEECVEGMLAEVKGEVMAAATTVLAAGVKVAEMVVASTEVIREAPKVVQRVVAS